MEYRKLVLLNNLQKQTFCDLKASKIHGVGVFAVKDIPKDINPFLKCNLSRLEKYYDFSEQELSENLNEATVRLIKKLIFPNKNYPIPENGINSINLSFYLNHSEESNMKSRVDSSSRTSFLSFFSTREVKAGEELFINYFQEFGEELGRQVLTQ